MDEGVKNLAYQLLQLYGVLKNAKPSEVTNIKSHKSSIYGMQHVYSFQYKDTKFYITDDYSLMDNPKFIRDVIAEFTPLLKGYPVENPTPQTDGAIYASGLGGNEYYLWTES